MERVIILVVVIVTSCFASRIPVMPAGSYLITKNSHIGGGELTTQDLPVCRGKEPCGYYTFDLETNRPLKWISSWCKCRSDQECVYSARDNKMKTYVHGCLNNDAHGMFIDE